jgi:hypothetical protein
MKEKLRRIELMKGSFERSKEKLELLEIYRYNMTDKNVEKGLKGEKFSKEWLDEKYGAEHVIDMTYPRRLTEINNLIVDALEGRGFHNYEWEKGNPEKPKYWDRYRKVTLEKDPERTDLLHLWSILKELEKFAEERKDIRAKALIMELEERFKELDAKDFLNSLGELKGSKIDFIGVECEKCGRVEFYDAKYWDDDIYPDYASVNQREYAFYREFSDKGIPFRLLYFAIESRCLYECRIEDLPTQLIQRGSSFLIPKKYLRLLKCFPKEEDET